MSVGGWVGWVEEVGVHRGPQAAAPDCPWVGAPDLWSSEPAHSSRCWKPARPTSPCPSRSPPPPRSECLRRLTLLEELDLAACNLAFVPGSLSALTALTTLCLDATFGGLRLSPSGWDEALGGILPHLTRCVFLDLSDNMLSVVPAPVAAMAQLETVGGWLRARQGGVGQGGVGGLGAGWWAGLAGVAQAGRAAGGEMCAAQGRAGQQPF